MFTKEELVKIRDAYTQEVFVDITELSGTIRLAEQVWVNVLSDSDLTTKVLDIAKIAGILETLVPGASRTQQLYKIAACFFLFGYNVGKAVEQNSQLENLLKKE